MGLGDPRGVRIPHMTCPCGSGVSHWVPTRCHPEQLRTCNSTITCLIGWDDGPTRFPVVVLWSLWGLCSTPHHHAPHIGLIGHVGCRRCAGCAHPTLLSTRASPVSGHNRCSTATFHDPRDVGVMNSMFSPCPVQLLWVGLWSCAPHTTSAHHQGLIGHWGARGAGGTTSIHLRATTGYLMVCSITRAIVIISVSLLIGGIGMDHPIQHLSLCGRSCASLHTTTHHLGLIGPWGCGGVLGTCTAPLPQLQGM